MLRLVAKPLHEGGNLANAPSHKFMGYDTLKEFKFLSQTLNLMSLLDYRSISNHLVVMKALHDVHHNVFTSFMCRVESNR